MNKFFQMLKENWIGGIIGAVIISILVTGENTFNLVLFFQLIQSGFNIFTIPLYFFIAIGYITGAFIQSKLKK